MVDPNITNNNNNANANNDDNFNAEEMERQRAQELAEMAAFEAHLLSVTAALGAFEDGEYICGDETLECLKDIKRYLRNEENDTNGYRRVFHLLCKMKTVEYHLIPILLSTQDNERIQQAIIEILVPLTWPLEKDQLNMYHSDLIVCKAPFLIDGVFSNLFAQITSVLVVPARKRTDKQSGRLRLLLTLVRNILAIRDGGVSINSSMEALMNSSLQEQIVLKMQEQKFLQLLVAFCATMDQQEYADYNLIILEIVFLVFSTRDPLDILGKKNMFAAADGKGSAEATLQKKAAARNSGHSRHPRFGGCLTVVSGTGKRMITHNNTPNISKALESIDVSKKQHRVLFRDEMPEFKNIGNAQCRQAYRDFADNILDNGFNTLMASVKKDVDNGRDKIRDIDYLHYLGVKKFFLTYLLLFKEYFSSKNKKPSSVDVKGKENEQKEQEGVIDDSVLDYDNITSVISHRNFHFMHKKLNQYQDEKDKGGIYVTLECLLAMMKIVIGMAASDSSEYNELATNLQNNMFHDENVLLQFRTILTKCKSESRTFLELLVEVIHLHLKMLEGYAKSKRVLFVRKKQVVKSKKQGTGGDQDNAIVDNFNGEEEEEETRSTRYVEREMRFEKIEMSFANETTVDVYCDLLKYHTKLGNNPLKCIVSMFHRIFVKCKMEAFFYKMSTLYLFHQVLSTPSIIPQQKEMHRFITFAMRRMFQNIQTYPLLFEFLFYTKAKRDCIRIRESDIELVQNLSSTAPVITSDDELDIKRGVSSLRDQIGIAVTNLVSKDRKWMVEWTIEIFKMCIDDRVDKDEDLIDDSYFPRSSEKFTDALDKDNSFALLLRLLGCVCEQPENEDEEDDDARRQEKTTSSQRKWKIPDTLRPYQLDERNIMMTQALVSPYLVEGGKPISSVLRRKRARATRKPREKKSAATDSKLSAEIIEDSDDFDDDAFFAAEAERRQRNALSFNGTRDVNNKVKDKKDKKGKEKVRSKDSTRRASRGEEEEDSSVSESEGSFGSSSKGKRVVYLSDSEDDIEEALRREASALKKGGAKASSSTGVSKPQYNFDSSSSSEGESDIEIQRALEEKKKQDAAIVDKNTGNTTSSTTTGGAISSSSSSSSGGGGSGSEKKVDGVATKHHKKRNVFESDSDENNSDDQESKRVTTSLYKKTKLASSRVFDDEDDDYDNVQEGLQQSFVEDSMKLVEEQDAVQEERQQSFVEDSMKLVEEQEKVQEGLQQSFVEDSMKLVEEQDAVQEDRQQSLVEEEKGGDDSSSSKQQDSTVQAEKEVGVDNNGGSDSMDAIDQENQRPNQDLNRHVIEKEFNVGGVEDKKDSFVEDSMKLVENDAVQERQQSLIEDSLKLFEED